MGGAGSAEVKMALAVARSLRRPAQLLGAALRAADRAMPDEAPVAALLAGPSAAACLAALLESAAPVPPDAARLRRNPRGTIAPGPVDPVDGRRALAAVRGPVPPEPAPGRGAPAGPGRVPTGRSEAQPVAGGPVPQEVPGTTVGAARAALRRELGARTAEPRDARNRGGAPQVAADRPAGLAAEPAARPAPAGLSGAPLAEDAGRAGSGDGRNGAARSSPGVRGLAGYPDPSEGARPPARPSPEVGTGTMTGAMTAFGAASAVAVTRPEAPDAAKDGGPVLRRGFPAATAAAILPAPVPRAGPMPPLAAPGVVGLPDLPIAVATPARSPGSLPDEGSALSEAAWRNGVDAP